MIIRPKSPLGLKYLQIVPGDSAKGFAAGDTIPLTAAQPEPVDIDQFFDMFDEKTRTAIQRNLAGFGNAFAGRGPQLNDAFGALRQAGRKRPAGAAHLVAPSTNFGGFWRALEALSATVAPVAETQASMFVALDRTFAAFARVSRPVHPGNDLEGPGDARRGDRRPAGAAALPPRLGPLLHRAPPGREGAGRNLADDRRRAARRHPGAQRLAGAQRPAAADRRRAARLPGSARRVQRPRPADRHQRTAQARRSGSSPRRRPPATTSPSPSATSPAPSAKATALGNWVDAIAFAAAGRARTPRAAPASAPANGPERSANHLHANPYPNTASPGQPQRVRGRQRASTTGGETAIGNTPGNAGHQHRRPDQEAAGDRHDGPAAGARHQGGGDRQRASSGGRATPLIAVIFLLIFTVGPYLAFTKHMPFTSYGYELKATFSNGGQHLDQLAGADRRRRRRQSDLDRTRRRRDHGHLHGRRQRPPIHDDAFAAIRPRIFLEGNFFIDLYPGSPSAPDLGSGDDDPGQPHLDRGPDRRDPDRAAGAGAGRPQPPAGELRHGARRTSRPRPKTRPSCPRCRARPAPRRSTAPSTTAARPAATAPRSPTPCSAPSRTTSRGWSPAPAAPSAPSSSHEEDLKGLIVNFDIFTGALAAQSANLSATIQRLAPTLQHVPRARWPASTARCRRCAPGRSSCSPSVAELPGPDRRRQALDRAGPAAALRQGGRRHREAAARSARRASPAPPRRARPSRCRSSTGSASARPGCSSRPSTRRSTTSSAPAGPTTASSSTRWPTSPAGARTSTATAPSCACSPAAATCSSNGRTRTAT